MNKYFKLFEECYLVYGTDNYAIYNILTGCVYQINMSEGAFLAQTENNITIQQAADKAGYSTNEINTLIDKLISTNLGMLSDTPVTVEKLTVLPKWTDKLYFKQSAIIQRASIGLNCNCAKNCYFCKNNQYTNKYRCYSCNGVNDGDMISKDKAQQIIDFLSQKGCKKLFLKNGDLIGDWDRVKEIIEFAQNKGITDITLSIVSSVIDSKYLEYFKVRDISIMKQCMVIPGENEEIFNEAIKYRNNGNKCIFLLLGNINQVEQLQWVANVLREKYQYQALTDLIVSADSRDINARYWEIESSLVAIGIDLFSIRQNNNECFFQSCYFDEKGLAYPCNGMMQAPYGDINELCHTFQGDNLSFHWETPLKSKKNCKKCELRYACNNCDALNYTLLKNTDVNVLCPKIDGKRGI